MTRRRAASSTATNPKISFDSHYTRSTHKIDRKLRTLSIRLCSYMPVGSAIESTKYWARSSQSKAPGNTLAYSRQIDLSQLLSNLLALRLTCHHLRTPPYNPFNFFIFVLHVELWSGDNHRPVIHGRARRNPSCEISFQPL